MFFLGGSCMGLDILSITPLNIKKIKISTVENFDTNHVKALV
jgi:hypothetical protein